MTSSYDSTIVAAFIGAHVETKEDGKEYLGTQRYTVTDNKQVQSWLSRGDTVPLSRVDAFLVRHGLHLTDLEMWALDAFGTAGFNSDKLASYY